MSQTQQRVLSLSLIFALALVGRALTTQFVDGTPNDPNYRLRAIVQGFDMMAQRILDGQDSAFWIDEPLRPYFGIYPPGYPLWVAFIYSVSGERSARVVQRVQVVLDALSVLLIVGVGTTAYGWRAGMAAGVLAALAPLLTLYGATPLADAPASWVVVAGMWMLLLAAKRRSIGWAFGAGLMVGASCWLRANAMLLAAAWALAMLFFVRAAWRQRIHLAAAVMLGAALLIAPIIIRNVIAFRAFVPTGMGLGTNLWEGLGETPRGRKFGAVYGDAELIKQERALMGLPPDAPLYLYSPDGVERDRERTRKALAVIKEHPFWYAGVMMRRMADLLNYLGSSPVYIYGSAGRSVRSERCLPPRWQGGLLALGVNILGIAQNIVRVIALPLMLCGSWLALRKDKFTTALILTTVLYYLVIGSAMHTEFRYGLPMQALLFVFAGFVTCRLIEIVFRMRQSAASKRTPPQAVGL